MAQGHDLQQNMVSYGANMMVANIQNSTTRAFMNSFTNTFLQTMFDNQQQAEQQRRILEQQLAEKRRREEEQRRIAEQQRLDAMFARLNRELKLEGVPFALTLKPMATNADLQLKGMNSGGPEDLKLKLGQEDSTPTSYGIKGLPGIYVGGHAGSDAATSASESPTQNSNLHSGPGTGQTGPSIPGLPGIYLDRVQPQEAPELAQAATHLSGPDQTLAQDVALQAAEKNPVFTGQSDDPNVQNFQQTDQQYEQDKVAAQAAQQQWTEAQSRADSDRAALELARGKVDSGVATPEQQQAYSQMVRLAQTDEDAAQKARVIFDGADTKLSLSRTNAASVLASLVPATGTASSPVVAAGGSQPESMSSDVVDLSHSRTTAPISVKLGTNNGVPIPAVATRVANSTPKAMSVPAQDLNACLGSAAGHPIAGNLPTVQELRAQLEEAQEGIRTLVENHETEEDLREDATEQINAAVHDAKKQAFDLTVDFVMHKAIVGVRSGIWDSSQEVENLQKLAQGETDPARLGLLRSQIQQATTRQENLKLAKEILDKGKERLEDRARIRDFREWTDKPEDLQQTVGRMEGVKQIVQMALSEKSVKAALGYTPYVNDAVKWGSSLIDTSYDLLAEYLSSKQLDQYNRNSDQYLQALDALNRRVKVTVAQVNCYKN